MQTGDQAGAASCRRVMLLGAGGHASDVLGVIERINLVTPAWDVVGIADDSDPPKLDRFANRRIRFLGTIDEALARHPDVEFLATVGFPAGRRIVAERAERAGCRAATLVDPRAIVAPDVQIGAGSVVLGGSYLSALVGIGRHVYVSALVVIGHDTVVGDFSSLMPGAMLCGDAVLGQDVLVGANATVLQGARVEDGASIGAGAVARRVAAGRSVSTVWARRRLRAA
jgi:sugar O-acyltransferase (sialic acid O-acetyltransferase NeuD family)